MSYGSVARPFEMLRDRAETIEILIPAYDARSRTVMEFSAVTRSHACSISCHRCSLQHVNNVHHHVLSRPSTYNPTNRPATSLMASLFGGGLLTYPFAYGIMGLYGGLCMQFVSALASAYSIYMIARCQVRLYAPPR